MKLGTLPFSSTPLWQAQLLLLHRTQGHEWHDPQAPKKSLLLSPLPGYTEELSAQSDQALIQELELITKEEAGSIASHNEQPISHAPSNVYVITDTAIRSSNAPDLPTVLHQIPGIEVMRPTGADFNVSVRGDSFEGPNDARTLLADCFRSMLNGCLVGTKLTDREDSFRYRFLFIIKTQRNSAMIRTTHSSNLYAC
jgi:hypothetical protein